MCGLFGIRFISSDDRPSDEKLKRSANHLYHRGPDAQDIYAGPGIGLAHTRLSFLDVSERGNQPMWDETGRYALVFNGEIYNHEELRRELAERGVNFRTKTDTEVLLYALIHLGPKEACKRVNAMFAFAFYDAELKFLALSRDRFGMKPLYYLEDGDRFLFSSETKAFEPWVDLVPDKFTISSYLLKYGGPMRGVSFYERIKTLSPGEIVTVDAGGRIESSYYARIPEFLDTDQMDRFQSMSASDIVDEFDNLFTDSVNAHMLADVPVGAFCSGGVDSSLLMAKAVKSHNNLAIFHADVKGQWSEHHAAAELASHLKLDLVSVEVADQDFVDLLPQTTKHYEMPITFHPNCAPLMMVARLARQSGVKGLLSGEGSDECFLGYPWLGRKHFTDFYGKSLRGARSMVHAIPELGRIIWPHEDHNAPFVRSILNRCEIDDDMRYADDYIANNFNKPVANSAKWTLEYLGYHLQTLLHRNDRMGMEASIEARFPFLDLRLAKAAVNLPTRMKLRPSLRAIDKAHPFIQDKWIVREVAARHLPRTLSHRKKLGFWTTVFKRLEIDPKYFHKSYMRDLIGITESQIDNVMDRCPEDLKVRLLHLDVWGETCLRGTPNDSSVSKLREHVKIRPE